MTLPVALALMAAIQNGGGASASAPILRDGLYGNVQTSAETGDLSGYEIRLWHEGTILRAELTVCEGWCNDVLPARVSESGSVLTLLFDEHPVYSDGSPAPRVRNRIVLKVFGRGAKLMAHWVNGVKADLGRRGGLYLKPLKQEDGLATARVTQAQ